MIYYTHTLIVAHLMIENRRGMGGWRTLRKKTNNCFKANQKRTQEEGAGEALRKAVL